MKLPAIVAIVLFIASAAFAQEQAPPTTQEQAPPTTQEQAPPTTQEQAPPTTQEQAPPTTQEQAPPTTQEQAPPSQRNYTQQNWFPQSVEDLGQYATSRTEFSFDRSMLVLASKVDPDDQSLRRVIAGVDGISVHRFHFQGPGAYDPRVLSAIRHDYSVAGWQHLSKAHEKYGYPSGADLWVHLEHSTIRNIAVLYAGANQINFFSVSGSISPVDLLHLAGHFGIPRVEGGVQVPSPGGAPQAAPGPMTEN